MIVILMLVLLLFGTDKLPEIAHSLGKSVKEFTNAQVEAGEDQRNVGKPIENSDTRIYKLAIDMEIDTKNRTTEQLIDDIRVKIGLKADK